MNLVSYEFGQVLQFLRLEEARPPSGVYVPDMLRVIRERYRFITGPDPNLAPPKEGAKFETGVVSLDDRVISIQSLGIYPDGLVVVCWNTDDADAVTDEFIHWAAYTFKLRTPKTRLPRRHSSNVVVEFDISMDEFLSEFNAIADAYQAALVEAQGLLIVPHLNRIAIGPDPQPGVTSNQTTLILEQRSGTSRSDNRYFSGAPLTSAAHVALLQEIEGIAMRRSARRR